MSQTHKVGNLATLGRQLGPTLGRQLRLREKLIFLKDYKDGISEIGEWGVKIRTIYELSIF